MIRFSVVVPVYNEEETVPVLYQRLEKVLSELQESYEIVFVNDGSRDNTMNAIKNISSKNPSVKAIELSRNFGLQIAYSAGIDHASGKAVIVMDGDLQDPPELIPQLIAKWKEGYDVVYTIKTKRKENVLKRFAFAAFYRILKAVSAVEMPLDSGSFSIMDRKVIEIFRSLPERNRLLSGIRAWVGFRQTGIEYERAVRYSGVPRQTLIRLFKMAADELFSFSTVPIRVATVLGLLTSGLALVSIIVVIILRLFTNLILVLGWTSLIIAIMFLGGVQLVFIGILGEYICRIFEEVKNRPLYLVKEKIGFDSR